MTIAKERESEMKTFSSHVEIWTDGGCKPNPGPGGWAALLLYPHERKVLTGGELQTTNNRMELTAVANALEALPPGTVGIVHTDSQYVKLGITQWRYSWLRRAWTTNVGAPVLNVDLWKRINSVLTLHQIEWKWVKAHSGIPYNEEVDKLATQAREDVLKNKKIKNNTTGN